MPYLSGLSVKELRDIARESGLYGHTALRKASLIKFLDRRSWVIRESVEKRMFPDSRRAWVGLFAVGNFAEHYAEVILHTLFPTSHFEMRESVVPRKRKCGRRRRNEVIEDSTVAMRI